MWRWPAGVVLLLSFSIFQTNSSGADDANRWTLPHFDAEGVALYKAASAPTPKAGTNVIVLDDEESYVFDAEGKAVRTQYFVYKILTQKGAEGWDSMSLQWEPWHEEKPTIRARVITADGTVHPLDPKTITDSPARDEDDKTYGDSREVRAPLPAIAPGSVVEEEEVVVETSPFFGAGMVARSYFGGNDPTQWSTLVLDAPASLPLRYSVELLPSVKTTKKEENGRVRILFEQGPMEPLDETPNYVPKDVPLRPEALFSTGASWQSVAEGYGKIVDEQASEKDVQAIVAKVVAGKTTREEKAAAIQQYLSREIRYTGVEFGDAAIVPHTPAETLKHKYGDCKDKATLAVAMLRSAGVPAYVALLNAGQRQDVPPDLPGMGMFDHAIVYAPGTPDIWIDATDQYARLGQLPQDDQGREALIARNESTALMTIPEASPEDNGIIEKREFYLAENGTARVVETTEPHGVHEAQYRATYADAEDKDRKKDLKGYVSNEYLSEKLTKMERSGPNDLTKQFQLVLEASQARRGFTDLDSAVAAIRVDSIFSGLPEELQERQKEPEKGSDETQEKEKKPRTVDYQLPRSFVREWHYKIFAPFGFQPKPLPPNAKVSLGPALLTEEFSVESDGSVRAVIKLDTVKRRLTVAEATELRDKVAELRDGPAVMIYFEPTAQALINQGKMREGFKASRDLIRQHPKEAVHHLQRAEVLLAAGMGQAAREEVKTAIQLEPSSALAQKTAAQILESDMVGRRFRRGSDYVGAESAFRAAKKFDPEDSAVVGDLAILLEYNHDGERYGPGAKLKESVAEYQSLSDEQITKIGLKTNLPFAQFYSGDFAGAKKNAESANPPLKGLVVGSETALNGTNAGMAEARKRTANEDDLKSVLKSAGDMLMRARQYSYAADMTEAGASGSNASNSIALAAMLRKAQPYQKIKTDNTPSGIVTKMFLTMMDPEINLQKWSALYSRNALKVLSHSDADEMAASLKTGRAVRGALFRTGYPADVMLDVVLQSIQAQAEGDDANGYRVTLRVPGSKNMTMWVVKEEGQYKILDGAENPNSIGLEILERFEKGNTAGARVLLDWVRDEEHLPGGDDPLAGYAFPRMWTKGKEADPGQMKVAAAAILAQTKETAGDSLTILEAARTSAKSDEEKLNVTLALVGAYGHLRAFDKLHTLASELEKQNPGSMRIFLEDEKALRGLSQYKEADALAAEMAKRLPDDLDVSRAFVQNAVARGDYESAHRLEGELVAKGKAESSDLNGFAWHALFTGKVSQEDLDTAIKAAQLNQGNNAPALHTLGCIYAEMGKTKEAREVLIQAMDQLFLDEPNDAYWYAFGRIAEQYGEKEVAAEDYAKLKRPKIEEQIQGSSYALAQLRLQAMRAVASSASDRKN
jgi:hypothetical protein